jgi:uncharacterized protein
MISSLSSLIASLITSFFTAFFISFRKITAGIFCLLFVSVTSQAQIAQAAEINQAELNKRALLNDQAFKAYERNDLPAATKYYAQAAKLGERSALYNLAVMRIRDEIRTPNLKLAVKYLEKSADLGFAEAQFMLASLYESGIGIGNRRKSLERSFDWHRKAAEQGHTDAALAVGTAYFLGRGVALDYSKAAIWYTKAAQQGDSAAQYLIASMYESATGVQRDLEAALAWYVAAARQGDVVAREKSKYIAELLAKERQS